MVKQLTMYFLQRMICSLRLSLIRSLSLSSSTNSSSTTVYNYCLRLTVFPLILIFFIFHSHHAHAFRRFLQHYYYIWSWPCLTHQEGFTQLSWALHLRKVTCALWNMSDIILFFLLISAHRITIPLLVQLSHDFAIPKWFPWFPTFVNMSVYLSAQFSSIMNIYR